MEKRHDFITIGELSKLTGVSAKSLRYYEKIGILRPAYVNPENGYRYYAYSQVLLVSAAQLYVEMDIPLNEIHHYIDEETGTIDCREQISYGIETAKQKLRVIQNQISYAERLVAGIDRSEQVSKSESSIAVDFPEQYCVSIPAGKAQNEQKYYAMLHRLLLDAKRAGLQTGCESGLLYRCQDGQWKVSVFVEILSDSRLSDALSFSVAQIPKGRYKCKKTAFIDVFTAAPTAVLFEGDLPDTVILSELFVSHFDYRKPVFELRWKSDS